MDDASEKFSLRNGTFFRILFDLLIEGLDSTFINSVAQNYIASVHSDEFYTLCFKIILEGVLRIQDGTNPEQIKILLSSYAGIDNAVFMARSLE